MPTVNDEFLLKLLQACAERASEPLYPARYADEQKIARDKLDEGLDELRRRGLVQLTDWVKDSGQGRALTEAGKKALATKRLTPAPAATPTAVSPIDVTRNRYDRGEVVRRVLTHPQPGYVSRVLLIANIGYFIVGAIYASYQGWPVADYFLGEGRATSATLIDLGGLRPDLVFPAGRPQFERILLHAFLHIGFFHLLMNMFFLGTIARPIEAMWGSLRFLAIYIVAAITGGCVVLLMGLMQREGALTAGASGALYGVFMAMLVWFLLNRQHLPDSFIQDMSRSLMPNVILMVVINFMPGISWQGHFGGAIGGLLAALLLHVQRFHPSRAVRILALLGAPMIPGAFFAAVLWGAGWF